MSNDPLRIFEPGFSDDTAARYQQQARTLIDAWRDEWHLEPEPEMDGATSQVYESLVNYVASALAAPASPAALRDEAVCLWKVDPETNYWQSACGTTYFNEDDPAIVHPGILFCHHCGNRIEKAL